MRFNAVGSSLVELKNDSGVLIRTLPVSCEVKLKGQYIVILDGYTPELKILHSECFNNAGVAIGGSPQAVYTTLVSDYFVGDLSDIYTRMGDATDYLDGTNATPDAYRREVGVTQIFKDTWTYASNGGLKTVATATDGAVYIKAVTVRANAAAPAHLTSISISCDGAAGTTSGLCSMGQVDIDAIGKQIGGTEYSFSSAAPIILPENGIVTATFVGTGATAVNLEFVVEYCALEDGGYLA